MCRWVILNGAYYILAEHDHVLYSMNNFEHNTPLEGNKDDAPHETRLYPYNKVLLSEEEEVEPTSRFVSRGALGGEYSFR